MSQRAAVTSATYNLANRLTARTAAGVTASPTWDADGNLTSDGVRTYAWDSRNRLTAITGVATFVYDTFNRRQTATRSGTATSFLYDSWDVVQEQQGGSPSADLLLGLGVDERLARGSSIFLTDALGSTVALTSSGAVQTSYGYVPYGASQSPAPRLTTASRSPVARTTAPGSSITAIDITIPLGGASSLKIRSGCEGASMFMPMPTMTRCGSAIPVESSP